MNVPLWLKALMAQLGAVIMVYVLARTAATWGVRLPDLGLVALQSVWAVLLSTLQGLPSWWWPLQASFVPALLMTLTFDLPPALFLGGFIFLWLMFRHNSRERVPLYLSNRTTCKALAELLPAKPGLRFIDLGSGLGSTVAHLARVRPDGRFAGVESAPLPYLFSRLRLLGRRNAEVRYRDIWREHLGDFDVVYAFLSPQPMPALWDKACREMHPGALLISNSFSIPGVSPHRVVRLNDRRRTCLWIFAIERTHCPSKNENPAKFSP